MICFMFNVVTMDETSQKNYYKNKHEYTLMFIGLILDNTQITNELKNIHKQSLPDTDQRIINDAIIIAEERYLLLHQMLELTHKTFYSHKIEDPSFIHPIQWDDEQKLSTLKKTLKIYKKLPL